MTRDLYRYLQMRVQNKGKGEFRAEDNTLWLYDVIASDDMDAAWFGGVAPGEFIAALARTSGPVTLRINSPGGSVFGAQAMVAAMRAHPHPITARIDSLAASAASVIAANCAACVMVPGSMQMIHRAWGLAVGNAADMRETADLLEKIDGLLVDAYAERVGDKTGRDDLVAMMAAETWFTPEEAVAVGLADEVAAENTQRAARAQWNLSAFLAAPDLSALAPPSDVLPEPPQDDAPDPATAAARAKIARQHRLAARLAANPI